MAKNNLIVHMNKIFKQIYIIKLLNVIQKIRKHKNKDRNM
jgi:hypothetical protein